MGNANDAHAAGHPRGPGPHRATTSTRGAAAVLGQGQVDPHPCLGGRCTAGHARSAGARKRAPRWSGGSANTGSSRGARRRPARERRRSSWSASPGSASAAWSRPPWPMPRTSAWSPWGGPYARTSPLPRRSVPRCASWSALHPTPTTVRPADALHDAIAASPPALQPGCRCSASRSASSFLPTSRRPPRPRVRARSACTLCSGARRLAAGCDAQPPRRRRRTLARRGVGRLPGPRGPPGARGGRSISCSRRAATRARACSRTRPPFACSRWTPVRRRRCWPATPPPRRCPPAQWRPWWNARAATRCSCRSCSPRRGRACRSRRFPPPSRRS